MRAGHVHRVTPQDVGSRISMRRWVDEEQQEVRDIVGPLVSYDDGQLVVDGRRGRETVSEHLVVSSRVVPEPPVRRPRPVPPGADTD